MLYPMRPRDDDRRLARSRDFLLRVATAPLRAHPSFLIVGAMKCGTSSLFSYLCQHPMVAPPLRKEIHYFNEGARLGHGDLWYRAHFPLRSRMSVGQITGEATPATMYDAHAVELLARRLPEARLVVILRDPVERAISHYFHEIRMGREYLPIEKAFEIEDARLDAARAAGEKGRETLMHACYKARGRYAEQIERLRRHYPSERVLVLGSGELFRDPAHVLRATLHFLGLPPPTIDPIFVVRNAGTNRTEVPESLRRRLQAEFEEPNEHLFAMLGRQIEL